MGTLVYFACEESAVEADRVLKVGGKIKDAKMSIGQYGFIALAFDTEGNLIELHSMALSRRTWSTRRYSEAGTPMPPSFFRSRMDSYGR
jgi:hypothetical protein